MQAVLLCIGVDVSKAELVVSVGEKRPVSVRNDAANIRAWLSTVPRDALIAMESTGRYHGCLAQLAFEAGLKVYVLNARDVFFYAKGLGARAKTDDVDAALIARYLAEHHLHLHPWQPGGSHQQMLQDLLTRRARVVTHRSALNQVFTGVEIQGAALEALNAAFETLLKSIDGQIRGLIDSDEQLSNGYRNLLTITGIGAQTASLLTVLLGRLQFANADALVAYSGLDPRPNDSGAKHGRRRLSKKGPALLRRQLYMAGLSASHSKTLKPLYMALRAKGFASTEAIVILGRKLLRVAWAVWKSGNAFDPARLGAAPACAKT
jgi:transposase